MKPDPKFGWNVLWIAPLLVIGSAIGGFRELYRDLFRKHVQPRRWTEEQKRLQVLAGIRKDKE